MFDWTEKRNLPPDARIYLDAGAREPPNMLRSAEEMDKLLVRRGAKKIHFVSDPNGSHNEASWRKRLLKALRFQFGTAKGLPY
jgi:hypothetical protein